MRRPRHTDEERKAIVERVRTSGRPVAEIAADKGVSQQTIQSWMRAELIQRGSLIEIPASRATISW